MKHKIMSVIEIIILIISIMAFSYMLADKTENVAAEEITTSVCCEKLQNGAWCQNAPESECDTSFSSTPTSCDATSFCRNGCCYDSNEGTCAENTPQKVCQESGGIWSDSEQCGVLQCELGCCVLDTQAAFVTLTRCKKLSSFYGLQTDFRTNINNELTCIATTQLLDRGACVYSTDYIKTCKFTTRENCESGVVNATDGQITSEFEFFKDYLCSADELGTNCGPTNDRICVPGKDEVYFVDSCGNAANIYDSSKVNDKSYWKKIIDKSESCGFGNTNGNANSNTCGNCDYFSGSFCREQGRGKPICADLSCSNTYDGKDYRNGESWCVNDNDENSVGARYFKHICINGEEILEPCTDFRQEICIEDSISTGKGVFSQAGCRANMWQECTTQTDEDDCENLDKRDCEWMPDSTTIKCVPANAPGLKHYEESDSSAVCAQANSQCVVEFEKRGAILIKKPETCIDNCECLPGGSWEQDMLEVCESLGDCGGKANFIGKGSYKEGYKVSKSKIEQVVEKLLLPIAELASWVVFGGVGVVRGGDFDDIPSLNDMISHTPSPKEIGEISDLKLDVDLDSEEILKKKQEAADPLSAIMADPLLGNLVWGVGVGIAASFIAGMVAPANSNADEAGFWAGLVGGTAGGLTYTWSTGKMIGGANAESIWKGAGDLIGNILPKGPEWTAGQSGLISIGIGVMAFIITYDLLYKEETKEMVTFECLSWEAPTGGQDCEKCNKDGFKPCSEYRCKSLGQACELLNAGSEEENCAWINRYDVKSPGISPWEDVLLEGYKYDKVRIRPPGDGSEPGRMEIISTESSDGCVKAFTPISFGILTTGSDGKEEPAQCKLDYEHTESFEDMKYYFGGSNFFLYNHSQIMSLPGPENLKQESPTIQNDGTYSLYIRCQDANGNQNDEEFAIRFCVDKGPDITPPKIEATSIINSMPISFNLNETLLDVYVNEPAECRWDRLDRSYDNMEQEMSCASSITELNNNLLYKCTTTLTGIKNREDNIYYFRCKDQPLADESDRNVNTESYEFKLIGTQPLNILETEPRNETIKGYSTFVGVEIKVETANGYSQGDAICYYSTSGDEDDYVMFYETGTNIHEQRQDLAGGSYIYHLKCVDLGGNTAYETISFDVEVDQEAPIIVRAYNDMGGNLKIITNEESSCSYSLNDCNFAIEDGTEMPYTNSEEHFADWRTDITYYIRCEDESGNQPISNRCSIIVRGYELS